METITWITPSSFVETDIYIIPAISKFFFIDWHIIFEKNESNSFEKSINQIKESNNNISISPLYLTEKLYTLKTFGKLISFFKSNINKENLLYVSLSGFPYFMPLLRVYCDINKTIVVIHNVVTPKGASSYWLTKWYTKYTLGAFNNYQTFSFSQYKALRAQKPNKLVFNASFALKDYGEPSISLGKEITFLSFGKIRDYKRIDVLISAAQKAYTLTKIPFKVKIAGFSKNWSKYQLLISHPFLFDLTIRSIPNEEIPNLFGASHYFVAPYQDIAQSGALIVAINYSKPIIASNLESFKEYVKDGKTGYLIRPANVEDLTERFCYILKNHNTIYPTLCNNIKKMKENQFSTEKLANDYTDFFNNILKPKK